MRKRLFSIQIKTDISFFANSEHCFGKYPNRMSQNAVCRCSLESFQLFSVYNNFTISEERSDQSRQRLHT